MSGLLGLSNQARERSLVWLSFFFSMVVQLLGWI
jgi:hypothetical protein